jgi:hypothetical protein
MSVTNDYGRLCNQIIRNLCVSLIAEKNDLYVKYASYDRIQRLAIPLYIGTQSHKSTIDLTDDNFFDILGMDKINANINANSHFFQKKDIMDFLFMHLQTRRIRSSIMDANPHNGRYTNNNDCFVHVRLTDTAYLNPGISYYRKVLNSINYDRLYIGTDQPDHPIIIDLVAEYKAQVLEYDEVETIQFASTNKHIILSHGSYSAFIGYLSFFSDIYYPRYDTSKMWHGDMFSIPQWNRIDNW